MIVRLRQPRREVEMPGGRAAHAVLRDLGLSREGHLVICNGTLVPSDTMLADDDVVATVSSLRDTLEVRAGHAGTVVEWLVEDGDPVSPGQPLLRLHPEGSLA